MDSYYPYVYLVCVCTCVSVQSLLFSVVSVRAIGIIEWSCSLFFLFPLYYFIVHVHSIPLIILLFYGYLGCFLGLALMQNAAKCVCVHISGPCL